MFESCSKAILQNLKAHDSHRISCSNSIRAAIRNTTKTHDKSEGSSCSQCYVKRWLYYYRGKGFVKTVYYKHISCVSIQALLLSTVSTLGSQLSQSQTIFLFLRDGKLRVEGHFWMSYLPSSLSLDGFCSPLKKWTTPTSGFRHVHIGRSFPRTVEKHGKTMSGDGLEIPIICLAAHDLYLTLNVDHVGK